MNLYIQIINNQPINHPIFEEHLLAAYPDVDLSNTTDFAPFIRLPQPDQVTLPRTELQVLESNYILMDDNKTYTDGYYVRDMTPDEITETTNIYINAINSKINDYIEYTNANILTANSIDLPIWQTYLDAITSFTYTDPFTVIILRPPFRDKDGNLLSYTATGAKPNVIG